VRIEVATCDGDGVGSGFLLSPRLVATVEHVVDGAKSIELKQSGKVVAAATVIGQDADRDVALLRTDRPIAGYQFKLARRPPRLGEPVVAIGFPLGLPLSLSRGLISGSDRVIEVDGVKRRKLIQTDAATNHGNSGGPLLATGTGEVLGLVDAGTTEANGLAFAVAAAVARPLLDAWKVAPQPIPVSGCESPDDAQSAAPPEAPAPTPPPPTAPAPGPPPAPKGSLTSFTGRYFTVSYPSGWTVETAEAQKPGYLDTTIRNPADPNVYLRVDVNPTVPTSDPLESAAPVVRTLAGEPGYQLLAYERTTFAGYDALHWEYLVPEHGVLLHKIDTFFIDRYGEGFAILTQSQASHWQAWVPTFNKLRGSLAVP
jgi:hypothetical protein